MEIEPEYVVSIVCLGSLACKSSEAGPALETGEKLGELLEAKCGSSLARHSKRCWAYSKLSSFMFISREVFPMIPLEHAGCAPVGDAASGRRADKTPIECSDGCFVS